jgi:hypothetical protein
MFVEVSGGAGPAPFRGRCSPNVSRMRGELRRPAHDVEPKGPAVPISQALACLVFAFWVSICAAAPEFIWQGLLVMWSHFDATQVYSAVFIGMLLAFFVEPVIERVKAGNWRARHQDARHVSYAAALSLAFGVVAVGVHEAVGTYIGREGGGNLGRQAALVADIKQVVEWAAIPFAVTLSWFVARFGRRVAFVAGAIACLCATLTGYIFGWEWREIATTSIPCCAIAACGCAAVSGRWDDRVFAMLAVLTAAVAAGWLALALLIQGGFWTAGVTRLQPYAWSAFWEDARFYFGWALGLAVAPNPVQAGSGRH